MEREGSAGPQVCRMSSMVTQEGATVAGKYVVERVLGEGGMGVVVKATQTQLGRTVAIKFLKPEAIEKPAVVERFDREARALGRLTSDHVTHVIDVDKLDDGSPFIVMEYLDGEDLATVVEREGPLPVSVAVGYVLEACEAIAAAHAMRIVHRDLKPSNLFLARRPGQKPIVKVLDFGISKVMDEEVSLTKTSSGLGSALYMAPEQMRNAKGCDERADLWALGIILYEFLTGVPPYDGESVHEVVANVLEQNRVKLSDRLPSVPPELDALVEECLVLDPKKRIASVAHVAERIAPFGPPGSAESVDRVRALLGVLPSETHVSPGPATQRSSQRDVDAIATAKTEEHLGVPMSAARPLSGSGRLALAGALVFLGIAGVAVALGLRRPVAVAGSPELTSATSVVATAPPSVTSAQASAAPTPSAAAPSASIESPPVVASAPPKKIDKPAQVAVAASTSPQPGSAPPPTSRPTAPATGGIVPISTMGIK